jgi:hypothetical protein
VHLVSWSAHDWRGFRLLPQSWSLGIARLEEVCLCEGKKGTNEHGGTCAHVSFSNRRNAFGALLGLLAYLDLDKCGTARRSVADADSDGVILMRLWIR